MDDRVKKALMMSFEGDFDGCCAALTKILEVEPANVDAHYELAMIQMMQGTYEQGCANLRRVLEIDPAHERAREQLRYC